MGRMNVNAHRRAGRTLKGGALGAPGLRAGHLMRRATIAALALALAQGATLAMAVASHQARAADNNVHLYGALVAEPCVISPESEAIQVEFGTIVDKYLYKNTRTRGQLFEIRLAGCDVRLGKTVKVIFTGTEDLQLPGLLALDGGSEATGIGIGLETLAAKPVPINKASDSFTLQDGTSTIALKAYVQGEQQAITDKAIGRGAFTATATFNLEYE